MRIPSPGNAGLRGRAQSLGKFNLEFGVLGLRRIGGFSDLVLFEHVGFGKVTSDSSAFGYANSQTFP